MIYVNAIIKEKRFSAITENLPAAGQRCYTREKDGKDGSNDKLFIIASSYLHIQVV